MDSRQTVSYDNMNGRYKPLRARTADGPPMGLDLSDPRDITGWHNFKSRWDSLKYCNDPYRSFVTRLNPGYMPHPIPPEIASSPYENYAIVGGGRGGGIGGRERFTTDRRTQQDLAQYLRMVDEGLGSAGGSSRYRSLEWVDPRDYVPMVDRTGNVRLVGDGRRPDGDAYTTGGDLPETPDFRFPRGTNKFCALQTCKVSPLNTFEHGNYATVFGETGYGSILPKFGFQN